jgi:integrase/recombinase XerD
LRVSELVGLRLDDVAFESNYLNLQVRGKGRKWRLLTLWKAVAESLRAWLAVRGEASVPELFLNARGKAMTRAGFEYVLRKHATAASGHCSSLQGKQVSPHVLRHYVPFLTMSGNVKTTAETFGHCRLSPAEPIRVPDLVFQARDC